MTGADTLRPDLSVPMLNAVCGAKYASGEAANNRRRLLREHRAGVFSKYDMMRLQWRRRVGNGQRLRRHCKESKSNHRANSVLMPVIYGEIGTTVRGF